MTATAVIMAVIMMVVVIWGEAIDFNQPVPLERPSSHRAPLFGGVL